MLKKRERLTKREFDSVFSTGKRVHSPMLQLIYKKSDVFHGSAVVGKKVYKNAVDRNKMRRRLYDALYSTKKEKGTGYIYIVIAKAPAKNKSYSDLRTELASLIERI